MVPVLRHHPAPERDSVEHSHPIPLISVQPPIIISGVTKIIEHCTLALIEFLVSRGGCGFDLVLGLVGVIAHDGVRSGPQHVDVLHGFSRIGDHPHTVLHQVLATHDLGVGRTTVVVPISRDTAGFPHHVVQELMPIFVIQCVQVQCEPLALLPAVGVEGSQPHEWVSHTGERDPVPQLVWFHAVMGTGATEITSDARRMECPRDPSARGLGHVIETQSLREHRHRGRYLLELFFFCGTLNGFCG